MSRVRRIDHINIRSDRMEESAAFYERLLELRRSAPPGMSGLEAIWMCDASNHPIVHLNAPPDDEPPRRRSDDTGSLDHVAFDCQGHDRIVATLEEMGAAYDCNFVAAIGLRQIFVKDPNGVRLELNFAAN